MFWLKVLLWIYQLLVGWPEKLNWKLHFLLETIFYIKIQQKKLTDWKNIFFNIAMARKLRTLSFLALKIVNPFLSRKIFFLIYNLFQQRKQWSVKIIFVCYLVFFIPNFRLILMRILWDISVSFKWGVVVLNQRTSFIIFIPQIIPTIEFTKAACFG